MLSVYLKAISLKAFVIKTPEKEKTPHAYQEKFITGGGGIHQAAPHAVVFILSLFQLLMQGCIGVWKWYCLSGADVGRICCRLAESLICFTAKEDTEKGDKILFLYVFSAFSAPLR